MNITLPEKRLISESEPCDFKITTARISDISTTTESFFEENFRGAIITECENDVFGYADVSLEGIAYYFKVLLNAVFGNSVVRVNMRKDGSKFVIKSRWRKNRELYDSELSELLRAARLSGFSLDFSLDGEYSVATVTIRIKNMNCLPIYAISDSKMHRAFMRVFFL